MSKQVSRSTARTGTVPARRAPVETNRSAGAARRCRVPEGQKQDEDADAEWGANTRTAVSQASGHGLRRDTAPGQAAREDHDRVYVIAARDVGGSGGQPNSHTIRGTGQIGGMNEDADRYQSAAAR